MTNVEDRFQLQYGSGVSEDMWSDLEGGSLALGASVAFGPANLASRCSRLRR